jgi:hypothetical protein
MIDAETLEKLQNVSIEERITIIETILQRSAMLWRTASIRIKALTTLGVIANLGSKGISI